MWPSPTSHGVKGLFPIIKRHCPHAISYPSRYAGLEGMRIAVDATLLLQRLHFADDAHPARHLLGFHRLIRTLRSHRARPIFVFDHPSLEGRLPQKRREQARRRNARRLVTWRADVEAARAVRLRSLEQCVRELGDMTEATRRRVADAVAEARERGARDAESWHALLESEERLFSAPEETLVEAEEHDEDWVNNAAVWAELERGQRQQQQLAMQSGEGSMQSIASLAQAAVREGQSAAEDVEQTEIDPVDQGEPRWSSTWQSISDNEESGPSRHAKLASRIDSLLRAFESAQELQTRQGTFLSDQRSGDVGGGGGSDDAIASGAAAEIRMSETAQQARLTRMERDAYEALARPGTDPLAALAEQERRAEEQNLKALSPTARAFAHQAGIAADVSATPIGDVSASSSHGHTTVEDGLPFPSSPTSGERVEEEEMTKDARIAPTVELPSPAAVAPPALTSLSQAATQTTQLARYYLRSSTSPTTQQALACAQLCTLLRVPVLWTGHAARTDGNDDGESDTPRPSGASGGKAVHEAEALCASLVRRGYADVVASEDSDVVLYEAPLLRNLVGTRRPMELVDAEAARRCLFPPTPTAPANDEGAGAGDGEAAKADEAEVELAAQRASRKRMLEFALLCGTDFNRTVPGIGPQRALELIRRHGDITTVLASSRGRYVAPAPSAYPSPPSSSPSSSSPDSSTSASPASSFVNELRAARRVFERAPTPSREHLRVLRQHGFRPPEERKRRLSAVLARRARLQSGGRGGRRKRGSVSGRMADVPSSVVVPADLGEAAAKPGETDVLASHEESEGRQGGRRDGDASAGDESRMAAAMREAMLEEERAWREWELDVDAAAVRELLRVHGVEARDDEGETGQASAAAGARAATEVAEEGDFAIFGQDELHLDPIELGWSLETGDVTTSWSAGAGGRGYRGPRASSWSASSPASSEPGIGLGGAPFHDGREGVAVWMPEAQAPATAVEVQAEAEQRRKDGDARVRPRG